MSFIPTATRIRFMEPCYLDSRLNPRFSPLPDQLLGYGAILLGLALPSPVGMKISTSDFFTNRMLKVLFYKGRLNPGKGDLLI